MRHRPFFCHNSPTPTSYFIFFLFFRAHEFMLACTLCPEKNQSASPGRFFIHGENAAQLVSKAFFPELYFHDWRQQKNEEREKKCSFMHVCMSNKFNPNFSGRGKAHKNSMEFTDRRIGARLTSARWTQCSLPAFTFALSCQICARVSSGCDRISSFTQKGPGRG